MDRTEIQMELKRKVDDRYRNFASSLLPGTQVILGVRLPDLRALAKKTAQADDWRETSRTLGRHL